MSRNSFMMPVLRVLKSRHDKDSHEFVREWKQSRISVEYNITVRDKTMKTVTNYFYVRESHKVTPFGAL